jgi:hypothetical protein
MTTTVMEGDFLLSDYDLATNLKAEMSHESVGIRPWGSLTEIRRRNSNTKNGVELSSICLRN